MMRPATLILLILAAILSINATPSKKSFRLPLRAVYTNRIAQFDRRANYNLPVTNRTFEVLTKVDIGTPPQTFELIVDTGSSYVAVADAWCDNCGQLTKYNGGASSTFKDLNENYESPLFGILKVTGKWTQDVVKFGDLQITAPFGRAMHVPDYWPSVGYSGVVGLCPAGNPMNNHPSITELFLESGKLDQPLISLRFVKNDHEHAGDMLIGAMDQNFIDGQMQMLNVLPHTGLPGWLIPIADVQVDQRSVAEGNAYIDSGRDMIYFNAATVAAIYAGTGAKKVDKDWFVPDPFPKDVQIFIGDGKFTIPKEDIPLREQAKSGNLARGCFQEYLQNGDWVFGFHFIKLFYVTYDFTKGSERVGIANRKDYK